MFSSLLPTPKKNFNVFFLLLVDRFATEGSYSVYRSEVPLFSSSFFSLLSLLLNVLFIVRAIQYQARVIPLYEPVAPYHKHCTVVYPPSPLYNKKNVVRRKRVVNKNKGTTLYTCEATRMYFSKENGNRLYTIVALLDALPYGEKPCATLLTTRIGRVITPYTLSFLLLPVFLVSATYPMKEESPCFLRVVAHGTKAKPKYQRTGGDARGK